MFAHLEKEGIAPANLEVSITELEKDVVVMKSVFPGDGPRVRQKHKLKEFLELRAKLQVAHPGVIVPPLPESENFVKPGMIKELVANTPGGEDALIRMLQRFLNACARHPVLSRSDTLLSWLGDTRVVPQEHEISILLHDVLSQQKAADAERHRKMSNADKLAQQAKSDFRQKNMPAWLQDATKFCSQCENTIHVLREQVVQIIRKLKDTAQQWRTVSSLLDTICVAEFCPPTVGETLSQFSQKFADDMVLTSGDAEAMLIDERLRYLQMCFTNVREVVEKQWAPDNQEWQTSFGSEWGYFVKDVQNEFKETLQRISRLRNIGSA